MNKIRAIIFCVFLSLVLNACNGKIPGADARKVSYDPKERVKKNLEEGRGFRLDRAFGNNSKGGNFQFARSNRQASSLRLQLVSAESQLSNLKSHTLSLKCQVSTLKSHVSGR